MSSSGFWLTSWFWFERDNTWFWFERDNTRFPVQFLSFLMEMTWHIALLLIFENYAQIQCNALKSDHVRPQQHSSNFIVNNTLSFCETSKLDSPASLKVFHIK